MQKKDWLTGWIQPIANPLIIRGARQVGKSTLVRQFADHKKLTLHEVNLERQRGESVQVEFDLLSLPLYMIEELPRIFGGIVARDYPGQG